MIVVIYAHPYPRHSRGCAALLGGLAGAPEVEVRSLYDRYPEFDIDAEAERAALAAAELVVWLHPVYWYTAPALMKLWFEQVLVKGWAYGDDGDARALAGKACLWVTTTGGDDEAYAPGGRHEHRFDAFQPVMEQTARFCGMKWLEPFVVHAAHRVDDAGLRAAGERLRERVEQWRAQRAEKAA